ncbi:MAG: glycosyltransferase [Chitinophagaceae bacterium]
MDITKTKVLFISKHAAHATMAMAGNQVFYNTLWNFCQDTRFETAFLTVQKQSGDFAKMKSTFSPLSKDVSMTLPNRWTTFTYLFYRSFLRVVLSLFRPDWYLLDPVYRFYFKKAIKKTRKQRFIPDIIVLEWTEVLFLQGFCRRLFPEAKIVVTEHDVTFTKLERKFAGRNWLQRRLVAPFRNKELEALQAVDLVRVLSEDDQSTLLKYHIDRYKIRLVAPFFQKRNLEASPNTRKQVVFYGALNRLENEEAVKWFIEKVYMPFRLDRLVSFLVVGGGNAQIKSKYGHIQGVAFTGYLEDPATVFVESLCMVVPLVNGGGIKIKVLEGMTCSLPVLTNEIGIEGIGGEDGIEFLYCKTPQDYEKAVRLLVERPMLRWDIGNHAREWVNGHFDYQKDLELYKAELERMGRGVDRKSGDLG